MITKYQVVYGTTIIPFSVKYSERTTMGITVFPDQSVEVAAPVETDSTTLFAKVEKRAPWILRKIRMYSRQQIVSRSYEWVSGESLYYLGRQYRLKVSNGSPGIKLSGKFLWVTVIDKGNTQTIKQLVEDWFKAQAKKRFSAVLEGNEQVKRRERVTVNRVIVRKLEKRWGSCTSKGNIILNVDLVKTSVDCINYVIVHELCHLKHLHHGKQFYRTLEKHLPEWRKLKVKLDRFSNVI